MKYEVTPEDVAQIGKFFEGTEFEKGIIKRKMREELTPEERLEGLTAEAIEAYLKKIKPSN